METQRKATEPGCKPGFTENAQKVHSDGGGFVSTPVVAVKKRVSRWVGKEYRIRLSLRSGMVVPLGSAVRAVSFEL